jgi:protein O-mannosyl-transferase
MGPSPRMQALFGALLIAGLVFLTYWPALHGCFILDDDLLLTDNALVKAPDGLTRIWFTREAVDYWPVTNSSFWIQWRLWGMNPTGYHVTNLLLHIIDCLLIWLLLKRLSIPGSFFAAILFAVHPVNVESVAWIAQHKNLLSLFFFLLSLLWYLKSQSPASTQLEKPPRRPPDTADQRSSPWNRWYFLSLLAFTLAMLSKGSVAILPLVLLLLIWWQHGRINNSDLSQTAPFFAVAIALTLVNIWFQTHGTDTAIRSVTFAQRLVGAGAALWFYLFKALLPLNLVFVYPQWNIDTANPLWWLPFAAAVAFTVVLIRAARTSKNLWPRNLLFAWAFFCIAILPVLGFVDVGYMKHSLVADHYQHIALIGIVALIAAAGAIWFRQSRTTAKSTLQISAAIVIVALALLSWRQSQLYASSITLYEATIQQNPSSWLIQTNLAIDLADTDQLDKAFNHAQEAVLLNPNYPEAHNALGLVLFKLNQTDAAMQQYRQSLTLNPNFAEAYCNIGALLAKQGETDQAMENLEHAIRLKPDLFQAHWYLAKALAGAGRPQESLEHLEIAAQLHPGFVEAQMNIARLLDTMGRYTEALPHYQEALRSKPDLPEAYAGMATVYAEMNRTADAIAAAQRAILQARSAGSVELANQLENWLTNYQQQPARSDARH